MNEDQTFPPIPEALISYLERVIPPCIPRIDWTDRRIWYELGRREVIEMLRREADSQRNR